MRSANRQSIVVVCSVFLFGSMYSTGQVTMRHEQNVQSQEQATRKTIDSFNAVSYTHLTLPTTPYV